MDFLYAVNITILSWASVFILTEFASQYFNTIQEISLWFSPTGAMRVSIQVLLNLDIDCKLIIFNSNVQQCEPENKHQELITKTLNNYRRTRIIENTETITQKHTTYITVLILFSTSLLEKVVQHSNMANNILKSNQDKKLITMFTIYKIIIYAVFSVVRKWWINFILMFAWPD